MRQSRTDLPQKSRHNDVANSRYHCSKSMHFDTSSSTLSDEGMRHDVLCAPAYICLVPRGRRRGEGGGNGEGRERGGLALRAILGSDFKRL